MNPEIQVYFFFIESLQEIRNLLGGKMWRPEVSLGSFLEIPPIAISQDLLRVSSFLIGCIL